MESKKKKFLEILKIELEDLVLDMEFSKEVLTNRLKEREITEYVFLENLGLLKKEILCIERIKQMLMESDRDIKSVDELRDVIDEYFKDKLKGAGFPNAVFLLISRKLDKISKYMMIDD